jgi:hypothetical protein
LNAATPPLFHARGEKKREKRILYKKLFLHASFAIQYWPEKNLCEEIYQALLMMLQEVEDKF